MADTPRDRVTIRDSITGEVLHEGPRVKTEYEWRMECPSEPTPSTRRLIEYLLKEKRATWRDPDFGRNDRTFLAEVLPHFTYEHFDVNAERGTASIQWRHAGAFVQVTVDWAFDTTEVVITPGVMTKRPSPVSKYWEHKKVENKPSVMSSKLAWFSVPYKDQRQNRIADQEPIYEPIVVKYGRFLLEDQAFYSTRLFFTHGPASRDLESGFQDQVNGLVDKLLTWDVSWKPIADDVPMPEPLKPAPRVDLSFADIKTMTAGLFKRNVV